MNYALHTCISSVLEIRIISKTGYDFFSLIYSGADSVSSVSFVGLTLPGAAAGDAAPAAPTVAVEALGFTLSIKIRRLGIF